jgi:hypothetical protein
MTNITTQSIIDKHYKRLDYREKYYKNNKEKILEYQKAYQIKYYHSNRFNLFLKWDLDESAFFTKKDYKYIEKMKIWK